MTLQEVLKHAKDTSPVHVTLVSNQANGIASYATGDLSFHNATIGVAPGGPGTRPAHMDSAGTSFAMLFSDRIAAVPDQVGLQQPFSVVAPDQLGISVSLLPGVPTRLHINMTLFGHVSSFTMDPLGDLFVGAGPSLGHSSAGIFVLAFTGVADTVQ